MSAAPEVDTVVVPSSYTNYEAKKQFIAQIGGDQINYNTVNFNNFNFGPTTCQVTIPTGQQLVKNMHLCLTGSVTYSLANPAGVAATRCPNSNDQVGFVSNPFWSCVSSIQMTLGSITQNFNSVKDTFDLTARVKRSIGISWDAYSGDMTCVDPSITTYANAQTQMDPLGNYTTQGFSYFVQPRTSLMKISPSANTNAGAVGQFVIWYSLNIPIPFGPLSALNDKQLCIARVGTLLLQINMDPTPIGMFNFSPAGLRVPAVAGRLGTFTYVGMGAQTLTLNYRTIQTNDDLFPLQVHNTWIPYYSPQAAASPAAPFTAQTISINQITLSTVPAYIIFAVRPIFANRTAVNLGIAGDATTNTGPLAQRYLPISGCNINYGKNNSLFIPHVDFNSVYDMYALSRKNGLEMSFVEYAGYSGPTNQVAPELNAAALATAGSVGATCGGFLVLTPQDLQGVKNPDQAPGALGQGSQLTLSGTITYYSQDLAALPANSLELVTYVIYNQLLVEVSQGNFTIQAYNSSMGKVERIEQLPLGIESLPMYGAFGSGLFSNLKGLASKALTAAVKNSDKIFDAARKVLPEKYVGAIDKIEGYSDKLKKLYEAKGSGISGRQSAEFSSEFGELIDEMQADGLSNDEIEKVIAKAESNRARGSGVEIKRQELAEDIDRNSRTVKSRLASFFS